MSNFNKNTSRSLKSSASKWDIRDLQKKWSCVRAIYNSIWLEFMLYVVIAHRKSQNTHAPYVLIAAQGLSNRHNSPFYCFWLATIFLTISISSVPSIPYVYISSTLYLFTFWKKTIIEHLIFPHFSTKNAKLFQYNDPLSVYWCSLNPQPPRNFLQFCAVFVAWQANKD